MIYMNMDKRVCFSHYLSLSFFIIIIIMIIGMMIMLMSLLLLVRSHVKIWKLHLKMDLITLIQLGQILIYQMYMEHLNLII